MTKISGYPEDTSPQATDYTIMEDVTAGATKKVKWQNILALASSYVLPAIYPVGCIYTETTGTNPSVTFGFGTWSAYSQGKVMVGQLPGDSNFGTAGATGGEVQHTLTVNEMPAHSHGVYDPGHAHGTAGNYFLDAGGAGNLGLNTPGNRFAQGLSNVQVYASGTGIGIYNTGGGAAHNVLQPFIVVYFWQRTA